MLRNKKTNGHLAMDVSSAQPGVDGACRLSVSANNQGPVTRSVFGIERVEKADQFGTDSLIRYGQKVRIVGNPHCHSKKLAVGSMPHGPAAHSPISRNQEASMHCHDSYNNVWVVDHCDPNCRFEMQGEPIKASEPILIRHCQTQQYLAGDSKSFKNDFGTEFEVSAHSFCNQNKTQNLALESRGNITVDVPTRFQNDQNVFCFECAPTANFDRSIEELQKVDVAELVQEIRAKVLSQSVFGVRHLFKIFAAADRKGDGALDEDDFRWGFIDFGITINKEEAAHLLKHFDSNGNGLVDFKEFLTCIRVSAPPLTHSGRDECCPRGHRESSL